jgi:electron transfer flavoprotein beta subunit
VEESESMKIVVLVKEVPDTYGDRKIDLETGLVDRGASEVVIDEISERAVELAVATAEKVPGTEVVALSMAPAPSEAALRKTLAIGADSCVQVLDDGLVGADVIQTATTIAAALQHTGFDLVVTGNRSTDGGGGVLPAILAELLEIPSATGLDSAEVTAEKVAGSRTSDDATMQVSVTLPAVISISERMPEARYPSFKGIMAAKKKPFETVDLATLGVTPDDESTAHSIVVAAAERPPRAAGTTIVDEGDAGTKLAEYLVQNRLA